MWVFGYGSLIWKTDFPFKRKIPGYIKGYSRKFWQGSQDHRGVPGKPGRVVTLVKSDNPEDKVWGVAYEIGVDDKERVKTYLDFREKDGYEKVRVIFHPRDMIYKPFEMFVYIGDRDNPFFLGPASVDDIADQIIEAEGPSGKNLDYFNSLVESMKTIAPDHKDSHLFELEKSIQKKLKSKSKCKGSIVVQYSPQRKISAVDPTGATTSLNNDLDNNNQSCEKLETEMKCLNLGESEATACESSSDTSLEANGQVTIFRRD